LARTAAPGLPRAGVAKEPQQVGRNNSGNKKALPFCCAIKQRLGMVLALPGSLKTVGVGPTGQSVVC